jgi:hypothetical protein
MKKKLIEVALPLAAVRAVIFAQMVADPSSRPDIFSTEKAQGFIVRTTYQMKKHHALSRHIAQIGNTPQFPNNFERMLLKLCDSAEGNNTEAWITTS